MSNCNLQSKVEFCSIGFCVQTLVCSKGKQPGAIETSCLLGLWFIKSVGFQLTNQLAGEKIMQFMENTFSALRNKVTLEVITLFIDYVAKSKKIDYIAKIFVI